MRKIMFAAAFSAILLAACQNQGKGGATGTAVTAAAEKGECSGGRIVYVHIDSLLMDFEMAKDLRNEFQAKYEKAGREVETKRQKLERDVLDFENKYQRGLATRTQLSEMRERLEVQNMQLQQDAEKLAGELGEEEQVMNNRVSAAVTDFLKEYNADFRYAMIIGTGTGNPILNADPALSITKEVLAGLNAKYAKEKAAKK